MGQKSPGTAATHSAKDGKSHCERFEETCGGERLHCHHESGFPAAGAAAQITSLPASERDEEERACWRRGAREIDSERLVFVDECGTHASMTRLYARAPRSEKAYCNVPRNLQAKNTTLLASMGYEGKGPCLAVEGATAKAVFEAYVGRVLAPSLSSSQVAHKSERVRQLIEGRGGLLLFLPPYSPDFSPIEEAYSKLLKALLRKAATPRARRS